jgi:hypothetical protein
MGSEDKQVEARTFTQIVELIMKTDSHVAAQDRKLFADPTRCLTVCVVRTSRAFLPQRLRTFGG